jgi:predicted N-acetyltransferase YhbS
MTVHPDHQRRGVGGLLLESGLKVANERGWKTVVMSQPQGIRLYEKHGFITSTVVEQDDSKFGGDFMVKDPEVQT